MSSAFGASVLTWLVLVAGGTSSENGGGTLQAVRIGVLEASGDGNDALAVGARAAAAELNAVGGITGRPLQLVDVPAARPWRDGASLMAQLAFDENVVALIGPADGTAAHAAAQIATRKRIPIITLSPEASLTQAMDPWIFRGVPDDRVQAEALLRWAFEDPRGKRAIVAVPEGRTGRERLGSLEQACDDVEVRIECAIRSGAGGIEAAACLAEEADVLLLWLDAGPARDSLLALEKHRLPATILGSTRLDDGEFPARLPPWARVAVPLLRAPLGPGYSGAAEPFSPPAADGSSVASADASLAALLGQDLVRAIAASARHSGAEPRSIRDGLRQLGSHEGRSGSFSFDDQGNRQGSFPIGISQHGKWVLASSRRIRGAEPFASPGPRVRTERGARHAATVPGGGTP